LWAVIFAAAALAAALGTATTARAQSDDDATQNANLPDAPTPQAPAQKSQLKQTIEVLGKRSIFFPELAHERRPLSSKQKLQLAVDETVIGYVALRIERSFAAAQAVVAHLDDEAMRHKRPLTRAFAAEILRATEA